MSQVEWTDEAIAILTEMYADTKTSFIADKLGIDIQIVYRKASRLNLKKSEAFKKSEHSGMLTKLTTKGMATRFKKGNVPQNKGKKQVDYMTNKSIERSAATRFKKGNVPPNLKEIGTERISKDGYVEVKTEKGYVLKHRHVWEMNFGPVPKKMNVSFKDGNKLNFEIGNLELLTKQQNMLKNSIYRFPPEVVSTIRLVSQLTKKINKHGDKKQN